MLFFCELLPVYKELALICNKLLLLSAIMLLFFSKKSQKNQKEAKKMVCDCSTSEEDRDNGIHACGEDCLNRMLMIEWLVSSHFLFVSYVLYMICVCSYTGIYHKDKHASDYF